MTLNYALADYSVHLAAKHMGDEGSHVYLWALNQYSLRVVQAKCIREVDVLGHK